MNRYGLNFRNMIVGVDTAVQLPDGRYVKVINFDNAATTPPFCAVMKELVDYAPMYASVHRGKGHKSIYSSDLYEESREIVRRFVNADITDEIIYTKNTTEAINILAHVLQDDDNGVILATDMEHLANDLPWRDKFQVVYVSTDEYGQLSLEDLQEKLLHYDGRVKLVAVAGASNVTGYINPVHSIAKLAHKYGAQILVDGAQLIPHAPFDMRPALSAEHIDYLVFSAHKMYAPFGVGVLIGPRKVFESGTPFNSGGGAVGLVSHDFIEWANPPARFEAGTPNMMGVVALTAAIKKLNTIGLKEVHNYEKTLIDYAIKGLLTIPTLKLYCYCEGKEERVSLISFSIDGIYHSVVAEILAKEAGIAVRSGLFCAHPYVEKLLNFTDEELSMYHQNDDVLIPGLVRISFGMYNDFTEIDIMINLLSKVVKNKRHYISKYKNAARSGCYGKNAQLYC